MWLQTCWDASTSCSSLHRQQTANDIPPCFPTSSAKQPSASSIDLEHQTLLAATLGKGRGARLAGIFFNPGCEVPDPPAFSWNKDTFCASLLGSGVPEFRRKWESVTGMERSNREGSLWQSVREAFQLLCLIFLLIYLILNHTIAVAKKHLRGKKG